MALDRYQRDQILRYVRKTLAQNGIRGRLFYVSYDRKADVVYVNFHRPAKPAVDSELTDDDVIIRYDEREEVVGLTILHARKRQSRERPVTTGGHFCRIEVIGSKKRYPSGHSRLRPNSSGTSS